MGVPQFQTVVAQAPRMEMISTSIDYTSTLKAGGIETTDFYAPSGYLGELVGLRLEAKAISNATTGTQAIFLMNTEGEGISYLYANNAYNQDLLFKFGYWNKAGSGQSQPPDTDGQILITRNIYFDSNIGLRVEYQNATDVAKNDVITIHYIWLRRELG